jgi:hypothetical protein
VLLCLPDFVEERRKNIFEAFFQACVVTDDVFSKFSMISVFFFTSSAFLILLF